MPVFNEVCQACTLNETQTYACILWNTLGFADHGEAFYLQPTGSNPCFNYSKYLGTNLAFS